MNRRGFLGFVAAGLLSVGTVTRLAETAFKTKLKAEQLSFADLVSTTFRSHAKEIAANVTRANPLLQRLSGGYEVVEVTASDIISAAEYSWIEGDCEIIVLS